MAQIIKKWAPWMTVGGLDTYLNQLIGEGYYIHQVIPCSHDYSIICSPRSSSELYQPTYWPSSTIVKTFNK